MKKPKQHTIQHHLHLACRSNDLNPQMDYIEFEYGMARCTNAHIAVVVPTTEIFKCSPQAAESLNGRRVRSHLWKAICGKPVHLTDKGEILFSPFAGHPPIVPIPTEPLPQTTWKTKFEAVWPKEENPIEKIAIRADFLNNLARALALKWGAVSLRFQASNKPMLASDGLNRPERNGIGIIMTVMITSDM